MSKGFASAAIAAMIIGGAIVILLNLMGTPTLEPAVPLPPDPAPIRKYDVVAEYPHDPRALTQGLIYTGGFFYESIGLQDQSSIIH
jgi:glutamine cyclotransferase